MTTRTAWLALAAGLALAPEASAAGCAALQAELGRLDQSGTAGMAARQRAELVRTEAYAARCGVGAACAALPARLSAMRANLRRLGLAEARGGQARARARVAAALRRAGCPAVAQAAPVTGLLGFLARLGQERDPFSAPSLAPPPLPVRVETAPERALRRRIEAPSPVEDDPGDDSGATGLGRGPWRTLCVRSCDGFFWPVSQAAGRGALDRDASVCRAGCPGQDVALYVHRPGGRGPDDATSLFGEPYRRLEAAFRFRRTYDPACACRTASGRPTVPDALTAPERADDALAEPLRGGFSPRPAGELRFEPAPDALLRPPLSSESAGLRGALHE